MGGWFKTREKKKSKIFLLTNNKAVEWWQTLGNALAEESLDLKLDYYLEHREQSLNRSVTQEELLYQIHS